MKKNYLLLFCLSLFISSCEVKSDKGFSVEGQIKGEFEGYLYLKYRDQIDSTLVTNHVFNFSGKVENPTQAYLYPGSPSSTEIMQLADFMIEDNKIKLSLRYKEKVLNIKEFEGKQVKMLILDSISGSNSELIKRNFDDLMANTFSKEKDDRLKKEILFKNLQEFIVANPKLELSGTHLANYANRHNYLTSTQIQELYQTLDTAFQTERDLRFIRKIINRRKNLDIGSIPPKIELPNQQNELISHESYQGKYLLLEFWASWCGPCRETNPDLMKVYHAFNRSNFEILGISQDKKRDKWENAIKEDKIDWIQVIDTTNATGKKYSITTIPFNVLLDREGKVIAKNLKPKELKDILEKEINE